MEYLGKHVLDRTSGLRGFATQHIEKFNGSVQYSVQPYDEDGKSYIDAFWVDEAFLELTNYTTPMTVTKPPSKPAYKVGVKIKDIISEKEGYVTAIITHVNGCTYYLVENKDGEFYVPTN